MSEIIKFTPRNKIEELLLTKADRILQTAPDGYNVHQMLADVGLAVYQNPALLQCDPATVIKAAMDAAALGLRLAPIAGEAYLVPYGNKCQLVIGYRGWKKIVLRTGIVAGIDAQVVYDGEQVEVILGTTPTINHSAKFNPGGEPVGAYAVAKFADGHDQVCILRLADISRAKAASRVRSGPWQTDFAAMVKKTAVLRLCKLLPETPVIQQAMSVDEPAYVGEAKTAASSSLRKAIEAKTVEPSEPEPPESDPDDGQRFIESLG